MVVSGEVSKQNLMPGTRSMSRFTTRSKSRVSASAIRRPAPITTTWTGRAATLSQIFVAAEAGLSSAQHYFATTGEMLRFALEHMVERSAQRIR